MHHETELCDTPPAKVTVLNQMCSYWFSYPIWVYILYQHIQTIYNKRSSQDVFYCSSAASSVPCCVFINVSLRALEIPFAACIALIG